MVILMNIIKNKIIKKVIIVLTSVLVVIALLSSVFAIYVNDYYHADMSAIDAIAPVDNVTIQKINNDTIIYSPKDATLGLIFYPGGKVEYTAYIPLMQALSDKGILCALVKMPFNLAVLDINAADRIKEQYPDITNWYIGGHSLGGSMAATYIKENTNSFKGLVLLGSYSTADLSDTQLKVISIYGSEDKVLNIEKYNEYKINLPPDFKEYVIKGGCHAYFGMYGVQDGDGVPTITNNEQIRITTKEIIAFIEK